MNFNLQYFFSKRGPLMRQLHAVPSLASSSRRKTTAARPASADRNILQLQRSVGNRAFTAMLLQRNALLSSAPVQMVTEATYDHFHKNKNESQTSYFNDDGNLSDSTGKKLSTNERRDHLLAIGIDKHISRGHVGVRDDALFSQGKQGKPNFSWSNDKAMLDAIQAGRQAFIKDEWREKQVTVDIPEDAGYGYVKGTDNKIYKVVPKQARIVRMEGGDLKTAYGVTEVNNPDHFDDAYYRVEERAGRK